MHTQQRNRVDARGAARFWMGVAQITRSRDRTFFVSLCLHKWFSNGSVLRTSSSCKQPRAVFSTLRRLKRTHSHRIDRPNQSDSEARKSALDVRRTRGTSKAQRSRKLPGQLGRSRSPCFSPFKCSLCPRFAGQSARDERGKPEMLRRPQGRTSADRASRGASASIPKFSPLLRHPPFFELRNPWMDRR